MASSWGSRDVAGLWGTADCRDTSAVAVVTPYAVGGIPVAPGWNAARGRGLVEVQVPGVGVGSCDNGGIQYLYIEQFFRLHSKTKCYGYT